MLEIAGIPLKTAFNRLDLATKLNAAIHLTTP